MVKKFKSRYGDERTLTLLEDGSYRVEGRTRFTRHADGMFDFEGGPCLMVGNRIADYVDVKTKEVIESIQVDEQKTSGGYAAAIIHTNKKGNKNG